MNNNCISVDEVRTVLVEALGIDDRALASEASAPLLGAQTELDSMGVLVLLYALEERFGIDVSGDEVTVEIFETLGSLASFVDAKRG
jgi:acyl carrier protein